MRFSTAAVPAAQRIQLWEDHNARALVGLEARTLSGLALEASELNLNLPRLQLARVSGSAHLVERSVRQIAAHPAESVVAYFALEGEGFFSHRDGCAILRPGQGILFDVDQPFVRGFSQGLQEIALKVPRRTFADLTGCSSLKRPQIFQFRGPGPGSAHAEALVRGLAGALSGRLTDWDELESASLDLLARILGDEGSPASHLRAAQDFIAGRISDSRLSAARIAAAVGISERQLSRVFAEAGASVPRTILNARLDAARRQLRTQGGPRIPLGELSGRLGFASQAHFSRSYKEKFGTSPLQDRRRA